MIAVVQCKKVRFQWIAMRAADIATASHLKERVNKRSNSRALRENDETAKYK